MARTPLAARIIIDDRSAPWHLTSRFGNRLVALAFNSTAAASPASTLAAHGVETIDITPAIDTSDQTWQRYGLPNAQAQALVLIRPDGYVMGRWRALDAQPVLDVLRTTGVLL